MSGVVSACLYQRSTKLTIALTSGRSVPSALGVLSMIAFYDRECPDSARASTRKNFWPSTHDPVVNIMLLDACWRQAVCQVSVRLKGGLRFLQAHGIAKTMEDIEEETNGKKCR